MRQIKFRVRDRETKKIVAYEYLTEDGDWFRDVIKYDRQGKPFVDVTYSGICDNGGIREQFTGFQDKAGKEIYAGDQIEGPSGKRATVAWDDVTGQWWSVPEDTTPNCPLHQDAPHCRVVSNIHVEEKK